MLGMPSLCPFANLMVKEMSCCLNLQCWRHWHLFRHLLAPRLPLGKSARFPCRFSPSFLLLSSSVCSGLQPFACAVHIPTSSLILHLYCLVHRLQFWLHLLYSVCVCMLEFSYPKFDHIGNFIFFQRFQVLLFAFNLLL